jgi:uncharacterized protein
MRHYTQLVRAAVLASLMLVAVGRAAGAGPFDDAQEVRSTAFQLFRSLAEAGDSIAQVRLGRMYEQGRSVPEDYALAALWYRRAADQGSKVAQWLLGTMYQRGYGVQQDYVQAHMWFNLSATQGLEAAVIARAEIEREMTRAQIAEAQKLARDWKSKLER